MVKTLRLLLGSWFEVSVVPPRCIILLNHCFYYNCSDKGRLIKQLIGRHETSIGLARESKGVSSGYEHHSLSLHNKTLRPPNRDTNVHGYVSLT